jgi:DNA-binding MarR family transcriptional regulator
MQQQVVKMVHDDPVGSVVRALRRVNFQGSIFGQSVAIRLGLSESDIDALEMLLDSGNTATAGRLAELLGMTTGAVTRVVDRLEQAGYVRRVADPADRRRVIIETVPERAAAVESLFASLERAAAQEADRYSPDQLTAISDFLGRMAEATGVEAARLRTPGDQTSATAAPSEHTAPRGGLERAGLLFRSGAAELRLRALHAETDLYRARFDGSTPQVRLRDGRVIVHYRGVPFDWRKRTATMALSAALPWEIDVVGGIQRLEADLREVDVRRFELTGGSERVQLELGQPVGEVAVRITGGAKNLRIERPARVPVRLRIRGGASHVEIDGQLLGAKGGEISIDTRDRVSPAGRYLLELTGGSRSIEVVARPD